MSDLLARFQDLPFVQFAGIQDYTSTHPRAARYLASIRSQQEVARIDRQHLLDACAATGVEVTEDGEQIVVDDRNVMGFLEVLDRRRYEVVDLRLRTLKLCYFYRH
jgi:hypothetical protein